MAKVDISTIDATVFLSDVPDLNLTEKHGYEVVDNEGKNKEKKPLKIDITEVVDWDEVFEAMPDDIIKERARRDYWIERQRHLRDEVEVNLGLKVSKGGKFTAAEVEVAKNKAAIDALKPLLTSGSITQEMYDEAVDNILNPSATVVNG
jgi:hypothetical protein